MFDLWTLAERQYGVVTREQARDQGYSKHQIDTMLKAGRLIPVHRAVYRVAGSPRTARQRAMAACFWAGPGSLCSHQTAGALLKLEGVRSRDLHITALQTVRRKTERPLVFHRTIELEPLDCAVVDDLPATSATRAILDLGAVISGEQLEVAFESARRLGLTSANAVARRFERFGGRGREGSSRVRQLLEAVGERPAESTLEVKANRLLRRSRLRQPQLQVWITGGDGRRYRVDFVWPAARLIVECDGFAWHGQHLAWKRDRRRVAALEAAGWRVVHVTWDDVVKHPAETLFRISTALEQAA
ncbi:MAG TPA: DUF559 domain-containing protein [Acidimicrobiia bacterium]|nr:DUF559 domain-containing protein [Acidimicrobiia bacterium]